MRNSQQTVTRTLQTWQLQRSPKYSSSGVVRVVPPGVTIRRVKPLMATIGMTRVAEVTGLDRVGIPNYATVRPREKDEGISYYNGKGLTRAAAEAGALMEAVERYSGEDCDLPVVSADRAEMERHGATVDPDEIIIPRAAPYHPQTRLEWVEGFDLLSDRPTCVPLNAVVCPYAPSPGHRMIYFAGSNGLASGNTLEEALCHALCEVVERDATAVSDAATDLAAAVGGVLESIGVRPRETTRRGDPEPPPLIDLDSLPPRARALVNRMRRAGLLVFLGTPRRPPASRRSTARSSSASWTAATSRTVARARTRTRAWRSTGRSPRRRRAGSPTSREVARTSRGSSAIPTRTTRTRSTAAARRVRSRHCPRTSTRTSTTTSGSCSSGWRRMALNRWSPSTSPARRSAFPSCG